MLEIILLLSLALLIRLLPVFMWSRDPSDAWAHVYYADNIKANGGRIPKFVNRIKPDTEFSYPWGIAWLLAKFKIKNPIRLGIIFNVIISIIEILVTMGFIIWFLGISGSNSDSQTALLLGIGFYFALPQVVSTWSGLYGLNARPLGTILVNVSVVTLVAGIYVNYWLLCVPILLLPIILLFSKFGIQAILLSFLILSVLTVSITPIIVFLVALLFSYVMLRKHLFVLLKGHYMHSKFYAQFLQFKHSATTKRCWTLIGWIKFAVSTRSLNLLVLRAYWTPILRSLLLNPWLLCIVWLAINYYSNFNEMEQVLFQVVVFAYVLTVIINIKFLRFLGEADRYLSFFATMSMAILISMHTVAMGDYIVYGLCLVISIGNTLALVVAQSKHKVDKETKSEIQLGGYLNDKVSSLDNIITIPTNLTQRLLPFINASFVGMYMNAPISEKRQGILKTLYPKNYPYPTTDFDFLKNEFDVKYLVFAKQYCTEAYLERQFLEKDLVKVPQEPVLFENQKYIVYKLSNSVC